MPWLISESVPLAPNIKYDWNDNIGLVFIIFQMI